MYGDPNEYYGDEDVSASASGGLFVPEGPMSNAFQNINLGGPSAGGRKVPPEMVSQYGPSGAPSGMPGAGARRPPLFVGGQPPTNPGSNYFDPMQQQQFYAPPPDPLLPV